MGNGVIGKSDFSFFFFSFFSFCFILFWFVLFLYDRGVLLFSFLLFFFLDRKGSGCFWLLSCKCLHFGLGLPFVLDVVGYFTQWSARHGERDYN